jgi:hypothetical protein
MWVSFWIVLNVLLYKYNFFYSYTKIKIFITMLLFFIPVELSSIISQRGLAGLSVILFSSFIITFLYIIYMEEIDNFLNIRSSKYNQLEQLKLQFRDIERELRSKQNQLNKTTKMIKELENNYTPLDLSKFNLTKSETGKSGAKLPPIPE